MLNKVQTKRGRPKKKILPPEVVELNRVKEEIGIDLDAPVEVSTNQSNPKDPVFISLAFGDKIFEGSGATLLAALQSMPVPVKITTKGLLKITDGVKKFEQMLQPVKIKRLFYPLAQGVLAKQLSYLLR